MSTNSNWKRFWAWFTRQKAREAKNSEFREFVYLDEISVLSLLVSREGELTEQIQEGSASEESLGDEVGGSVGIKGTSVSSKSSFQTKSSRSVQATKKANIQSQFRKLHKEVKKAGLLFPVRIVDQIDSEKKLLEKLNENHETASLTRGTLVELEIQLAPDQLFSISSIITEIMSMSEDHPGIFGAGAAGVVPSEMKSYANLLDRFMAGLVPIRSTVTNVRLWNKDGKQYLVESDIASELKIHTEKLELVAVLEKDRFWKDMRRVLFSGAAVTVLGRVSVSEVRNNWTPVKLFDLFVDTIPGGEKALADLQSVSLDNTSIHSGYQNQVFEKTLGRYVELVIEHSAREFTDADRHGVNAVIAESCYRWNGIEAQRSAFLSVAEQLAHVGIAVDPAKDADFRQSARQQTGIGPLGEISDTITKAQPSNTTAEANLLEVEVVAMYW